MIGLLGKPSIGLDFGSLWFQFQIQLNGDDVDTGDELTIKNKKDKETAKTQINLLIDIMKIN